MTVSVLLRLFGRVIPHFFLFFLTYRHKECREENIFCKVLILLISVLVLGWNWWMNKTCLNKRLMPHTLIRIEA